MQVSVIIVNFNTFQLTSNCIQSVIDQTQEVSYEIILVDNASTECDPDLFRNQFHQIKLIKNERNLGFAGGNNLGLKYATGEYILLLNSDTILIENSLQFIYNKCKGIGNLGAASIRLIYPGGEIQHSVQRFPSITAHLLFTTRLNKVFKHLYERKVRYKNFEDNFPCDWIWGTFFFFPAKNLLATDCKLSETYFMYGEDMEWCLNFKERGLQNYYFGSSKIIHLKGKSSTEDFKNGFMLRNYLHFIRTRFGYAHFCIEMLLRFVDNIEVNLRGKLSSVFHSKYLRLTPQKSL